jgi:putative ABC transport system permease protein
MPLTSDRSHAFPWRSLILRPAANGHVCWAAHTSGPIPITDPQQPWLNPHTHGEAIAEAPAAFWGTRGLIALDPCTPDNRDVVPLVLNAPFPALLLLSWRGLFLRPIRTVLTVASVAVAMAGLVLFLSLGTGLRQLVSAQTNSIRAQLQISRTGGLLSLVPTPALPQTVAQQAVGPGVRYATPIVLQSRSLATTRIPFRYTLYAIPADAGFERVYPYARAASGRTLRGGDAGQDVVVLGSAMARQLQAQVGDQVTLLGTRPLRVLGILDGTETLADTFVIVPLDTAQRALKLRGLISLVAVETSPGWEPERVAASLRSRVDGEVQSQVDFKQVSARLLRASDVTQFGLALTALVVGLLSVITTLSMVAHERHRELAILRALGLRPGAAATALLLDAALLTLAGGLVGGVAGWLLAQGLNALTNMVLGVGAAHTTVAVLGQCAVVLVIMAVTAGLPASWSAARGLIGDGLRSG